MAKAASPKKEATSKVAKAKTEKAIKTEKAPKKEKKAVVVEEVLVNTELPTTEENSEERPEITIEKKVVALLSLQMVDSEIDKIRIVRGELPLEVQDLEDEIEGLETRTENIKNDTDAVKAQIKEKEIAIKDHQTLMKKYEAQQLNVRNNREYESLSKEIEYQSLEIQLCEKRINEYKTSYELKKEILENATEKIKERKEDLKVKKQELEEIVSETEKEEQKLVEKSEEYQKKIEDTRLMSAYHRIRKNARNGLAVVLVERDACGGCFNKIPPQRQLDIKMHKKIIVCEYCGRILIDRSIEEQARKQN
jgi:predicted  nucleic acid-binding Zn-ribbon protein